ncbi:MAG: hypothetical protein IPM56_05735 [Ignavibacteriales bacterium]|nr:MAG: hypothetical protein IPM56_05735 [Ignavibacteriales bacterium]
MNQFSKLFIVLFLVLAVYSFAQNRQGNFWQFIDESDISLTGERLIIPQSYRTARLDVASMKEFLKTVPMEFSVQINSSRTVIFLPMPDGSLQKFKIVESPVMAPELSDKYPEIKTYAGQGIDDQLASVRFDVTPHGFHAQILSPNGRVFIDPHNKGDVINYISYFTKNFVKEGTDFDCSLEIDDNVRTELEALNHLHIDTPTGPQLRTYRVAVAATGEYTAFHGGTVPLGLAAVVTSVNRVNGVYETEVAVRMVLVANNDTLIFTNASTDPYTNNNGSTMLGQNQTTIDNYIGTANYDFGHVFSTGGGGVASLGVICRAGLKARGVTGSGSPVGDPFDIDYVAHEMGHQFAGNHSFNGNAGSCSGGNRNAATAYEPGSGSTIMAYAGICGSQNLQSNSDPYFHVINFDEIVAYTNSGLGNGCPVTTATGNDAPTVSVPTGGFTIPKSTPFSLTGSATDPNSDPLTYSWEQFDLGPAGAPPAPSGNAPIFRVWNPTASPTRYFPRLQNLLNNSTVIGEILPSYARTLTFRLVARDGRAGGGGVNYAQLQFNVDGTAGPFVVTSPNTNVSWEGNTVQTITWDVSSTNIAPVNCANVRILLSTNGGQTFDFVVLANTPNDGSEAITLPNLPTSQARIKVEAVGNIFFDISNVNFTILDGVPVELASFTAEKVFGGVRLNWVTATETNNQGFTIERSSDNENFSELKFIQGNGTTTSPSTYTFFDESVETGVYYYRLKQTDFDGSYMYLNVVSINVGLPDRFELSQNHPNPFNPSTKIKFLLPADADVSINLFNTIGQKISEIVNTEFSAGVHEINFNASGLSSGVYYYTMNAASKDGNSFSATKKMILMK